MAGQGLNLGIADADALARVVLEGRRSGADLGSMLLLERYEEERKVHSDSMLANRTAVVLLCARGSAVVQR